MRRGYKLGKRAVKELSWFQEACESKKRQTRVSMILGWLRHQHLNASPGIIRIYGNIYNPALWWNWEHIFILQVASFVSQNGIGRKCPSASATPCSRDLKSSFWAGARVLHTDLPTHT